MSVPANILNAKQRARGRPTADRAPDTRFVMATALRAFSREGFDGASMRDVAGRSGVDPALLSRQYGSKQRLWEAVVEDLAEQMRHWQKPIWDAQSMPVSAVERLEKALGQFAKFCVALPELNRFFVVEIRSAGTRADHVMKMLWRPHELAILPLLQEAARPGQLRVTSPELASTMMIGMVCLPILVATMNEDSALPEDYADQLTSALISTLVRPAL